MRKLMRSISPFSKKNVTVEDPGPSVPITSDYNSHTEATPSTATPKPTWSVEGINFLQFLQIFYEKFNPEKLSNIDFISKEYKGEEMVLIYELAEKYNLSHEAMQKILNLSKDSPIQIDTSAEVASSSRGRSGPPSYSSFNGSNGSVQNEPQELHSVVAPNWQSKRVDRTSFRNVSPYVPRAAVAESMGVATRQSTDSPRDSEIQSKSAPMSLQDIIQTTRQNDLLSKKSVRFSVTEPETDDITSENNSLQSGTSSSLLSTKRVSNFGSNSNPSTQSISSAPSSIQIPNGVPDNNPPRSRGSQSTQSQQPMNLNGASSLQTRIRSSLVAQSLHETDSGMNATATNGGTSIYPQHSTNGSGNSPNQSPQSIQQSDSVPRFQSTIRVSDSFGSTSLGPRGGTKIESTSDSSEQRSRMDATRIQELEAELEMIKFRLHESENEREDLLRVLEDSWKSPEQVLRIVHSFLEKYDRRVELPHSFDEGGGNSSHPSSQSSFAMNHPSARVEDLEGRRAYRSERSLDVSSNPQLKNSAQEKPYMLGTVSSVKRGMEAVLGTNTIPTSRESSPSVPTRGRSPSPRQASTGGTGRWIRPSSADRSQRSTRSSSPASSISDVSSRYRGYTPPTRDHSPAALDSHFQKTKQRLQQETNQERQNHDHDQSKLEKRSKLFEKEKSKASLQINNTSPGRINGQSPLRGARPGPGGGSDVDDWVTCIDPKTQRKYYYSKSRKVSSWTLPTDASSSTGPEASNKFSWSPSSGRTSRSSPVPGRSDSRSSTPNQSRPNSRERSYPQRAPSPTGSLTSTSSQNTTRERSNSSSVPIGGGWFEAVDPQSGRMYWFNRATKQSTWKKPNVAAAVS